MNDIEKQEALNTVTKRLVILTLGILIPIAIFMYTKDYEFEGNSYLVLLVFASGVLGGFVSIQQRLPKISSEELRILSNSYFSITLIPVNGGIFALILMLMFAGNIIQGQLFPTYSPIEIHNTGDYHTWLTQGYPKCGADIAKLLFWSFVAGFSERLVPQIIRKTAEKIDTQERSQKNKQEKTQ